MKTINKVLFCVLIAAATTTFAQKKESKSANPRTVTADMNAVSGPTKTGWRKCVGAGRANEGLRADWQEQLRKVKKDIGFENIRMHGLLHDDMGVYFEEKKGKPTYNWQYIDQLYDFLIGIGVKPFVELSFMPKDLASGPETVFWWKGNITPPKDYDKWYNLIKALTEHFTERYGVEEVKTWYFEVWNEPNHPAFFKGNQDEYFKMYNYTAKAIKAVNTDYKVGGPASAGNKWVSEIIDYCDKQNVPIDFIATHTYSVIKGTFDESGKTGIQFNPDPLAVTKDVINSRQLIQASAKPNLELHYTEWSSSYSSSDPIHDTYQSAAFILDKIKGTENYANSMSYWTFTDIFEEKGPRATPFHGGFGLLNYQSIKKPAYYAYEFLNKLGETEIKSSDNASWVCKNNKGDIQSLIWDFTITQPEDKVFNGVYYKREIPAKPKGTVQLKYKNVEEGKYQLSIVKVGYQSNDLYGSYMKMGSPNQLTKKQVQELSDQNSGAPIINEVIEVKKDKVFNYQLPMRENDVYFMNLIRL